MGERPESPLRGAAARNLRSSYELELTGLQDLHAALADELQDAFDGEVSDLLRQLSDEDGFFSITLSSNTSETTPGVETSMSFDDCTHRETMRSLLEFIRTDFMPAPKEEQMRTFHGFLNRVKENVSRIRLSGGASSSQDRTAPLQQCVTAVRTMRAVIISKFEYVRQIFVIKEDPGKVPPNPTSDTSNTGLIRAELQNPRGVDQIDLKGPFDSSLHVVFEGERKDGSSSSPSKQLTRQDAEDKD